MRFSLFVVLALRATTASGHPGADHAKEAANLHEFLLENRNQYDRNDLSHCAEAMRANGIHRRNIKRRSHFLEALVDKNGLQGNCQALSHEQKVAFMC